MCYLDTFYLARHTVKHVGRLTWSRGSHQEPGESAALLVRQATRIDHQAIVDQANEVPLIAGQDEYIWQLLELGVLECQLGT